MATAVSGESLLHSCVKCEKGATKSCSACREGISDTGGHVDTTWYCGTDCQKAHWSSHKVTCKAVQERKILYRAGDIAQLLFYMYREIVFDILITKVEKTDRKVLLYEGEYKENCFVPFPTALFPEEREKQAVLTYLACGDAIGYMHETLGNMLKSISSDLVEVSVSAWKYQLLHLKLIQVDGEEDKRNYEHEVLQVVLKHGGTYIMDLTGAQYGHYQTVTPVKTYFHTRADFVHRRNSFGHQQNLMKGACGTLTWEGAIRDCNEQFCKGLNLFVHEWQKENVSLGVALRLTQRDFLHRQRELLAFVEHNLRAYKKWAEEGGSFKVCMITEEGAEGSKGMAIGARTSKESLKQGKTSDKVGSGKTFEEDVAELLSGNHKVIDLRGWN